MSETDNYLAKVLPLKIQNAIFSNSMKVHAGDKETKLSLLEYTDEVFDELLEDYEDESFKFDKTKFTKPSLKS